MDTGFGRSWERLRLRKDRDDGNAESYGAGNFKSRTTESTVPTCGPIM